MTEDLSIEQMEAQEADLVFDHFDEKTAVAIGMALVEAGEAIHAPIVVNIRTYDRTLFHAALAGSSQDNDHWARRKSNFALRMQCSSMLGGARFKKAGKTVGPELGLDPMEYASHGGSVPIRVAGAGVIGAITVSGLASKDDHRLVVEAVRETLKKNT